MLLAERAENERLRQIIKELQRHRFGRRAETLPEDQLLLGLEEAEQVEAAGEAESEEQAAPAERQARAAKRRANRGSLPAHLPRIEMVVDIDDHACPCCRNALHRIGEDVSERLDIVPAQFRVLVVRRPKYACRACEDVVVQAPAPARLIEGGLPTEATVAQVLVSKYADHLPLYRQAQIYARQGINLDRSTLADWVGRAALPAAAGARAAARQAEELAEAVRRRDHGAGARSGPRPDQDRPALGLCPRRPALGRSRSAGRRLRLRARPQGRAADRASRRLQRHPAGRRLWRLSRAGRAAATCSSPSAGRMCAGRFYELAAAGPAPIASEALEAHRRALRGSRTRSAAARADERRAVRQERSRPDRRRRSNPGCARSSALISQKTKLAEAIRYALSRWEGLTRFLDDGRIEIDSNVVERAIRPIALNRKNALFAGSDGGAEHWAVIASLIETCKLNGVEPHGYLADVITRIVNGHPNSQIDELLPWAYSAPPELKAVA